MTPGYDPRAGSLFFAHQALKAVNWNGTSSDPGFFAVLPNLLESSRKSCRWVIRRVADSLESSAFCSIVNSTTWRGSFMTQLQLRFSMRAIALALFLCCIGATFGYAQATNTGTIVGTVTDQSGAVIPDATITLTDISTNDNRSTVSGSTGQYVFVNVPPGSYIITATKTGFELNKIANQTVKVGTQTTAN